MSKPVKQMIMDDYERRFSELEGALVVDIRGIEANDNNELRLSLAEQDITIAVVKNTLARRAFDGTGLEALTPALDGPSALAYGAESVVEVARAVVAWAKKVEALDLKGAVLDGEYFEGEAGVKRLSTFPTKDEAQAKVVQLVLTPAGNIVGAATSGGSKLLGIVKEIEERLERGEAIAKVG
ncbi:MAG: 50S ribosomal protein L10 [Phycisphaerales bacterium]|nr:50S ribosomal protein L10 [Phycisphaerae bacterium]NNF43279.1 50S ribosomal protein L10 [Phycisphaerales bacterium]NNM26650.1 50S ribosomal protein L10 [Phycisphaerales bacterium]